jgi:hypothetical protein
MARRSPRPNRKSFIGLKWKFRTWVHSSGIIWRIYYLRCTPNGPRTLRRRKRRLVKSKLDLRNESYEMSSHMEADAVEMEIFPFETNLVCDTETRYLLCVHDFNLRQDTEPTMSLSRDLSPGE